MADKDDYKRFTEEGANIGSLFAQTVEDVSLSLPPRVTGAIDLRMTFNSVHVSESGWKLIYVKTSNAQTSLSIDLATRINTADLNLPDAEELITFVQKSLRDSKYEPGPSASTLTPALNKAVAAAIESLDKKDPYKGMAEKLNANEYTRFYGYLQMILGLPPAWVDGLYGSVTQRKYMTDRAQYGPLI